jgi:hypothetical protein
MKTIKNLTFATLAALAATLLFQTSITRADDNGEQDEHGQQSKVTFTKHVVNIPNQPGLIANMMGVGEGDAGDVLFTGEVLSRVVDPNTGAITRVAFYHFTGSKHSFSVIIHGVQQVAGIGQKGVVIGVVTEGWLKGHAVAGEWTEMPPCYAPGTGIGNCFEVTLSIARDSRDSIDN